MNIEVEVRAFISKERYEELLVFFSKEGELLNEDEQETHYFDCVEDVRIQKNKFFSKIWMKKGVLHDEHREETEIKLGKEEFPKLQVLFQTLGHNVDIKWFRTRHEFKWQDINVCVDYTKGFGYILELEKMSDEQNKDAALELIKQKLADLNIRHTPKEEFNKQYNFYKENWKSLV